MKTFAACSRLVRGSLRFQCTRVIALAMLLPCSAWALNDLTQLKIYGHWSQPPANYLAGFGSSLSEKWALLGAEHASEQKPLQGAVQVFNAVTGAWTRELLPPGAPTASTYFGTATAISGDLAVISAVGVNGRAGEAYVYNLTTGAMVRPLLATGGVANDLFGNALAVAGNRVLVGANGYNGSRGAAYLFDLTTGAQLHQFDLGGSATALDNFGSAIAAEGNLGFIGAPGRNGSKGAAYLYDLTTFQLVGTFQASTAAAGDKLGAAVALSGDKALVGAPGRASSKGAVYAHRKADPTVFFEITASDGVAGDFFGQFISADAGMLLVGAPSKGPSLTGGAYLYDLNSGSGALVRSIVADDAASNAQFGYTVALWGNTALIAAPFDGPGGSQTGAAYLVRPLVAPLSELTKVAARGDFAPAAPDCTFNTLGDAFLNSNGEVSFFSSLAGGGSNGGTDNGVWTTMTSQDTLQLSLKSRSLANGPATIQSTGIPLCNESQHVMYIATLKTGVYSITALNNKRIYDQTVGALSGLASTHDPVPSLSNAKIAAFGELVQSSKAFVNNWAVALTLAPEAATSTTAANDSAIVETSTGSEGVREGSAIAGLIDPATHMPVPGNYGQLSGRVAYLFTSYVYSAATTAPLAGNQVVMQKSHGNGAVVAAQKGLPAPVQTGTPVYVSFLGETADSAERVLYHATLSGTGVTTASNEGLWTRTTGAVTKLTLQKGQPLGMGGPTVAKIINAWTAGASKVMALVQLAGTGVTASNDMALLLAQEDDSVIILMREGEDAQGRATGATIGTISRVEVDPYNGSYAVLATLAGAAAGSNQALYTGKTSNGDSSTLATLRRPVLYLRKGWVYDNELGAVKSISLPLTNIPASGIGGTGRGRAISLLGHLAVTVEFNNGIRQIMTGAVH